MAWINTLQEANYRDFVFDIVKVDDDASRALVEHNYPYKDGADIEDMGRGARHINVEAVFFGPDYEMQLQWFLGLLDQPGSGKLIHPVFGNFEHVQVAKYAIHHEADNVDQASVIIEFVESTTGEPFFNRALPSQTADAVPQHGATATAAATDAHSSLVDRLRAVNPLATLDALRAEMTGPLLAVVAQAGVVLSGLDVLAYPRAWGNDISALVGGLLDIRDFSAKLSADWASIQSDLNAFSIFSAPDVIAPLPVSYSVAPTEPQVIAATKATVQVNTAVGLVNAASFMMISESVTPTLSPAAIENIVNVARTAIDTAIAQLRAIYGIDQSRPVTEPLKDQALALQEAARQIIEVRPPLIVRVVETPGNFRLLAHQWYGDHSRAAELYLMNGARSPFVEPGDNIHAYAK